NVITRWSRIERVEPSTTQALIEQGVRNHENGVGGSTPDEIIEETKKQLWIAASLIAVSILQYFLQVISIMFEGHLGELPLSSSSMATSFAFVSGFSVLISQSNSNITCLYFHISSEWGALWRNYVDNAMEPRVSHARYPHTKSHDSAYLLQHSHSVCMVLHHQHPHVLQSRSRDLNWCRGLQPFLQSQNLVFPMMTTFGLTAIVHVVISWVLVFKLEMGIKGAALAYSVSYLVNVIMLATYVKLSALARRHGSRFLLKLCIIFLNSLRWVSLQPS
ncbi:hypothetical protein V2J09_013399, partial [Rumex salicifolius]